MELLNLFSKFTYESARYLPRTVDKLIYNADNIFEKNKKSKKAAGECGSISWHSLTLLFDNYFKYTSFFGGHNNLEVVNTFRNIWPYRNFHSFASSLVY